MTLTPGLTWDQVFAWRLRRQLLDPPAQAASAVNVVRRLCGVQAQVASAAELAVAIRQAASVAGEVERALADRALVKTWAMRGTLHLLAPEEAGAYLSLVGTVRSWERPSWQRTFGVSVAELAALADAVAEALDGRVLSREELVAQVLTRTGNAHLDEQLRSGWGAVLKPLAWQGLLCHGPSQGARVTFTRPATWLPSWRGVPDPLEAAEVVIPAYLRAHGPATMDTFDRWLTRGASRKAALRAWFAALGNRLATVEVDGEPAYALAEDVDELAATPPTAAVRLLPGFDQYVLGAGTHDVRLIPADRRAEVSRTAGWISPVVLAGGRVAGVWRLDGAALDVTLFPEAAAVAHADLKREVARLAAFLARDLALSVQPSL